MKKRHVRLLALLICAVMLNGFCFAEDTLTGQAQLAYETIRWDVNPPKTAELVSANEYLFKIIAAVLVVILNYFISKLLVFRKKKN